MKPSLRLALPLVLALAVGCDAGSSSPPVEPTVAVATYLNPIAGDHTEDRIAAQFMIERIEWTSVGSLGMTLHVPASKADRAREILRAVPNVDVL